MGITGGFFKGAGDMKKTTYDPNDDGVIAVAQTEADMKKTVYDTDDDGKVENSDYINGVGGLCGKHMTKAASNSLRNSHDAPAEGDADQTSDEVIKTITLSEGIKGIIRVKFALKGEGGASTVYGRIFKNGVAIGTRQSEVGGGGYAWKEEDLNVGTMEKGEIITLNGSTSNTDGAHSCQVENFRLLYDNISIPVVVATVNS